jgi:long-chain acyl-CoA synthetase
MEAQSIPQMFFTRAAARGDQPAQRVKVNGAWRDTSWRELHSAVRHTAQGLLDLGAQPGDHIAILSDSRAEWVQCDLAIQATGAITIPIYPSLLAEQAAYILQNSEASLVFVDTPAQLAKINRIRDQVPGLRHIVSMHAQAADADTLSLAALAVRGVASNSTAALLDERVAQLTREDEATYV